MSIMTEDNRTAELTTDGVETEFDFAMLIHADTEVQVWYEPDGGEYELLVLDTDYTVSFIENGGAVTTIGGSSPRATGKILIIRHVELTQKTNWLYNDNHTGQQHQDDFDQSVMRDLQIQEQLDRCLQFDPTSPTTGITLPEPDAGKFLQWKSDESGFENVSATVSVAHNELTDILADPDAVDDHDGRYYTQTEIGNFLDAIDYAFVSGNDATTDITAAQLEQLSDGSETALHIHDLRYYIETEIDDFFAAVDYDFVSGNDAETDVTGSELETLSDGSDGHLLHIHDSAYYTETEIDTLLLDYSLIDGTRAFTGTISGIFPTVSSHLATKEYVDSAITFIEEYFFTDTLSNIGGIYFDMIDMPTGEAESEHSISTITNSDGQPLVNFATVAGVPGLITLDAGIYGGNIHALKSAGGQRGVKIYYEIHTREADSPFTETLLVTSEESDFLTVADEHYTLHATLQEDVSIAATDRIIVKWFANGGTGGGNATVLLRQEGDTSAHLNVPISSNILSQIYLRQDGQKPLTGNWDVGGFNITGVGKLGIGTDSPQVGLHGVVLNGAFIFNDNEDDGVNKLGRWGISHRNMAEEPFYGFVLQTLTSKNELNIGGGTNQGNAATSIKFLTATNTTTTFGTVRMTIDKDGNVGIGTDSPQTALDVVGTITATAIGIGTNSPDQELEVRGVSPIIRIRATGGAGNAAAYVEFGRTTGGNWVRTGYVGDAISGNEDIYLVAEDSNLKLGDSSSNAVLTLSGGNVTATNDIKAQTFSIGSGTINETELTFLDGAIAGTVVANKAVVVDGNKDISSFRNLTATGTIIAGNISLAGDTITFLDGSTIQENDDGALVIIAAGVEDVIIDSDLDMEGHEIRLVTDLTMSGTLQFNTGSLSGDINLILSAPGRLILMETDVNLRENDIFNVTDFTMDGTFTDGTMSLTAGVFTDVVSIEGDDVDITAGTGDYTGQDISLTLSATADAFCVDGVINSFEVSGASGVITRARVQSESSGTFTTGTLGSTQLVLHQITADLVSAAFAMAEPKMGAADYTSQWSGDVTDVRSIGGSATIINRTLTAGAEWSGTVTSNSSGGATLIFENIGSVCEARSDGALVETAGTLIFNAVGGDFMAQSAALSIAVTGTPEINYIGVRGDGTAGSHTGDDPETTSTGGLFTAGGADDNIGIKVNDVSGGTSHFAIQTGTGDHSFGGASDKLGFYAKDPVALQTGVAVTDVAIHAALVSLGLITGP